MRSKRLFEAVETKQETDDGDCRESSHDLDFEIIERRIRGR